MEPLMKANGAMIKNTVKENSPVMETFTECFTVYVPPKIVKI